MDISKLKTLKCLALLALVAVSFNAGANAAAVATAARANPRCEFAFSAVVTPNFSKLTVDLTSFNGQSQAFIPNPTWLAMALPYKPLNPLLNDLEKELGYSLLSRGEAHVTVLTPPEFIKIKSLISIEDINRIATNYDIQSSTVTPLYLGQGKAMIDGLEESTFYIVVDAPKLLEIRRAIAREFLNHGGAPGTFDPELYYPHITVGFTKRDLSQQDGVLKDRSTFISDLKLNSQK